MRVVVLDNLEPLRKQTLEQQRPDRDQRCPVVGERQAGLGPVSGLKIRMRLDEGAAVGEGAAVAGVEIGLRRQPLGQDHVVPVEFDMPVFDAGDLDLRDRESVDERRGRRQHAKGCDVVARAQPQFTRGLALAESVGRNADRPEGLRIGMRGDVEGAMADPDDGPRRARGGDDEVALAKVFDGDVAARGGDARAAAVAGERDVRAGGIVAGELERCVGPEAGEGQRSRRAAAERQAQRGPVKTMVGDAGEMGQVYRVAGGEAGDHGAERAGAFVNQLAAARAEIDRRPRPNYGAALQIERPAVDGGHAANSPTG